MMKLKEACEIAYKAGLDTVGEAILTAELYADTLFSYGSEAAEYEELLADVHRLLCRIDILDVYPELYTQTAEELAALEDIANTFDKDIGNYEFKEDNKIGK